MIKTIIKEMAIVFAYITTKYLNLYEEDKSIIVNIPLTEDIFKIDVNNINDKDSYYEFTSKKGMNIVLLIIGAFCISVALALLVLVIRQFNQTKYLSKSP